MSINAEKFNVWQSKQIDVAITKYERRFYRHINSLGDDIAYYLKDVKRIDNISRPKIDSIIAQLVSVQNTRYQDAVVDFMEDASKLADYVKTTEAIGLGVAKGGNPIASALKKPISASGLFVDEHVDNLINYNNKRLADTIRTGWAGKMSVDELSAVIIGTEKQAFADGLIHKQKTAAHAALDTALQHVGQVAKAETWVENEVYTYRILSTLDTRTSEICRDLDGKIYEWGAPNSRVPPFHYLCRTVIIPEIDKEFAFLSQGRTRTSMYGAVDANTRYNDWAVDNKDAIAKDIQLAKDKAKNARARARAKLLKKG